MTLGESSDHPSFCLCRVQFFITCAKCDFLDGKYVAFGPLLGLVAARCWVGGCEVLLLVAVRTTVGGCEVLGCGCEVLGLVAVRCWGVAVRC